MSLFSSRAPLAKLSTASESYFDFLEEEEPSFQDHDSLISSLPASQGKVAEFYEPSPSKEDVTLRRRVQLAPPLARQPKEILSMIRSFLPTKEKERFSWVCKTIYRGLFQKEFCPLYDESLYKILLRIFNLPHASERNQLLQERLEVCFALLAQLHCYREAIQNENRSWKIYRTVEEPPLEHHEIHRILQKVVDLYVYQQNLFHTATCSCLGQKEVWVYRTASGQLAATCNPDTWVKNTTCLFIGASSVTASICTGGPGCVVATTISSFAAGLLGYLGIYCCVPIQNKTSLCPSRVKIGNSIFASIRRVALTALLHGFVPQKLKVEHADHSGDMD